MAKSPSDLSVQQLEKLLTTKKSQLDNLLRKRSKLQKELEGVEQSIGKLAGRQPSATAAKRPRKKAPKRAKNVKPLTQFVTDLLSRHKKGLSLADLCQKILGSGYKTNSANFSNVLYQCLYNREDVKHDEKTGLYRLT